MIDQPTIDRILDAANIVDVVSEFVTLRKRGINFVGLCPFHSDTSPSFFVSPAKNICKCFACGEGGTAVHFVMKHEQISYFDALRLLAKKYNIEVVERELSEKEKQTKSNRESMLIVNTWAQSYFSSILHEHTEGRSVGLRYFIERGFREDIIKKFQLGYCLEQRDAMYNDAVKNGYKPEFLQKTGLTILYDNGKVSDRFWGRVIFPIHSVSGKVVGFGGRVLKKDAKIAKYLNSSDSEVYHKSNELYGIYFAKQAIVKQDRCFLVEGYTDVISMHQSGIENVVSSSGTALTSGQIRLIHRFTNNITILYDGDAAGIKAALRGIDLLLEEGMNIKVVLLPDGEDPDSFARKNNAEGFSDYIKKEERDFIRFKADLLLKETEADPIERSKVITDIITSVAVIPDDIARSVYIRECSSMMEIDERVVLKEVNNIREKIRKDKATPQKPKSIPVANLGNSVPPEYIPHAEEFPPGITEEELAVMSAASNQAQGNLSDVPAPDSKASLYERYEVALIRYVVRYGERVLFEYDDDDEQHIIIKVAEYIKSSLEQDDLMFENKMFRSMLDEAVVKSNDKGFIASRYFLAHQEAEVSRMAANLIDDRYQLSKYHSKYRQLEQESDRLDQYVIHDLHAIKDAYIMHNINEVKNKIKRAQAEKDNLEEITSLMIELSHLNEVKGILSKELGERIILKM
jgi:DNA primase, catalytic core